MCVTFHWANQVEEQLGKNTILLISAKVYFILYHFSFVITMFPLLCKLQPSLFSSVLKGRDLGFYKAGNFKRELSCEWSMGSFNSWRRDLAPGTVLQSLKGGILVSTRRENLSGSYH